MLEQETIREPSAMMINEEIATMPDKDVVLPYYQFQNNILE